MMDVYGNQKQYKFILLSHGWYIIRVSFGAVDRLYTLAKNCFYSLTICHVLSLTYLSRDGGLAPKEEASWCGYKQFQMLQVSIIARYNNATGDSKRFILRIVLMHEKYFLTYSNLIENILHYHTDFWQWNVESGLVSVKVTSLERDIHKKILQVFPESP